MSEHAGRIDLSGVPTERHLRLTCVFHHPLTNDPEDIVKRLEGLENELRDVRREAAELRAAHDDAIDLALIGAVPNTVFRLINDARVNGWTVTYSRRLPRGMRHNPPRKSGRRGTRLLA